MRRERIWLAFNAAAVLLCVVGIIGCVIGIGLDRPGFFRAWLCAYLLWLGVPLAGVTLVLVHDLSGGQWMATARPVIDAALVTMPLASIAGIPSFVGLQALYGWSHSPAHIGNAFYLNPTGFFVRYALYLLLWNLLAAYALWGPRVYAQPIAPAFSWLSGLGLIALAVSTGFASIDWMLSLEPSFWSSAFPYAASANWFNTGMALILLTVALSFAVQREHMADLAKILLATTIFWAYIEFVQFLIIWEENLRTEIPWYLKRLTRGWSPGADFCIVFGFALPFIVLLWGPAKRSRPVVGAMCLSILAGSTAYKWYLVLPEFNAPTAFWLDVAAVLALGSAIVLIFAWALRLRLLVGRRDLACGDLT